MTVTGSEVQGSAFEDFKAYNSATRKHSQLVLSQILRQHHPDFHVVQVDTDSLELRAYAEAGFAKCELDDEDGNFTSEVEYEPNHFRADNANNPGKLEHTAFWAKYKYTWNEQNFLLYNIICIGRCGREEYDFFLTPRGTDVATQGVTGLTKKLFLAVGQWSHELHEEVYVFDQGRWLKSKSLWKDIESSSWDDVVLDPAAKEGLIEDVEGFFDSRDLYREFQMPWKRGIIFHGLPGNGKTISIKALMSRLQKRPSEPVPSLYVKSFVDMQGGPQWAIHNIFRRARKMAPCLLIFEDLDSLIKDKTRSYFLNEVDGLENNDGILMVGSTNHLDKLDSAIRDRPSRFDRKYHFKLPTADDRAAYAQFWRRKLEGGARVEFPEEACRVIAAMTDSFSFAYLKELFVATLMVIARGGKGDEPLREATSTEEAPSKEGSDTVLIEGSVGDEQPDEQPDQKDEKVDKNALKKKQAAAKKAAAKREKLTAARLRRQAVLDVEIPESLKDSVLVKVIQRQILVLLDDMDNSEDSEQKKQKKTPSNDDDSDSDSDSD